MEGSVEGSVGSHRRSRTARSGRDRLRQVVNLLNGSTVLGLALARAAGVATVPGPRGLRLAVDYPARPPAPRAGAVTVGDVVLLRASAAPPAELTRLIAHEHAHAQQWARWGGPVGFLPAYLLASGWSWLVCGHPALRNVFEVAAGLADGGYPEPEPAGAGRTGLARARVRRRRPGRGRRPG